MNRGPGSIGVGVIGFGRARLSNGLTILTKLPTLMTFEATLDATRAPSRGSALPHAHPRHCGSDFADG